MKRNIIVCDRCKFTADIISDKLVPKYWTDIFSLGSKKDFCPKCSKEFEMYKVKFIKR